MTAPAQTGFQLNRPTMVALLYLGGFITGLTVLIGLVLAYMWKNEPMEPWEDSHYRWHIRTFWIGLVYSLICTLLVFILIGALLYIVVAIWFAVRTIKALLAAQKREPVPGVESWLL
ncbi:DUF4870 family protein [Polymorphobacter sp.]|uniref:DUF4870 family protein n=1 Tax=Polymorphobacter sp. TaxID=1909290 RepID=UPI003F718E43